MYKDKRIVIVIPAYNEERLVGQVLADAPDYVDYLIVVDDCSTDETARVIQSLTDDRLIRLRTENNQGVGGATVLGYLKARELDVTILPLRPWRPLRETPLD